MKRFIQAFLLPIILMFSINAIQANTLEINQPAPNFTAIDSNGQSHQLSDFKGKVVVLEWTNHECPFVKKHYDSGNMQKLQQKYTAKNVVWLTIISSAPDKEGYVTGDKANAIVKKSGATPTAILLDASGELGKLYHAKTTPEMFVINTDGNFVYIGAIDDKPTTKAADIDTATNYVSAALDEVLAGKAVTTTTTKSYGCNVKYGS